MGRRIPKASSWQAACCRPLRLLPVMTRLKQAWTSVFLLIRKDESLHRGLLDHDLLDRYVIHGCAKTARLG